MKKKINGFIGKLEMDSSDRGRKKDWCFARLGGKWKRPALLGVGKEAGSSDRGRKMRTDFFRPLGRKT